MDSLNELQTSKVLLVGINTGDDELFNYEMTEMVNLCAVLDLVVVETIYQNLSSVIPATYLGKGKVEEVKACSESLEVDYIIFNDELSPVQFRNLSDSLNVPIFDRTMLILEIFKVRARTKEATLQVELAELKYQLPRLAGSYTSLSRIGGGGGGTAGARRGSGETKLELDRRHIEKRISKLKDELDSIVVSRKTSRKARDNNAAKTVAFVGYTNAGKSSTINALLQMFQNNLDKQVFVKDMLFATLETSTRKIKLPNNLEFLITDTVGFVSHLPHHLIESFKSTLEEITEADLIIHIVDASSPYLELQVATTNTVLKELGVSEIPTLYAFNKIDVVPNLMFIPKNYEPSIYISSVTKEGYPELISYIENSLFPNLITSTFLIPFTKGEVYSAIKEKGEVFETEYLENGIKTTARLSKYLTSLYREFVINE